MYNCALWCGSVTFNAVPVSQLQGAAEAEKWQPRWGWLQRAAGGAAPCSRPPSIKCSAAVRLSLEAAGGKKHKRVKGTLVRHTGAARKASLPRSHYTNADNWRGRKRGRASGDGMKRRRDRVQAVAARHSPCQSSNSSSPVNGSSLPLLQ